FGRDQTFAPALGVLVARIAAEQLAIGRRRLGPAALGEQPVGPLQQRLRRDVLAASLLLILCRFGGDVRVVGLELRALFRAALRRHGGRRGRGRGGRGLRRGRRGGSGRRRRTGRGRRARRHAGSRAEAVPLRCDAAQRIAARAAAAALPLALARHEAVQRLALRLAGSLRPPRRYRRRSAQRGRRIRRRLVRESLVHFLVPRRGRLFPRRRGQRELLGERL